MLRYLLIPKSTQFLNVCACVLFSDWSTGCVSCSAAVYERLDSRSPSCLSLFCWALIFISLARSADRRRCFMWPRPLQLHPQNRGGGAENHVRKKSEHPARQSKQRLKDWMKDSRSHWKAEMMNGTKLKTSLTAADTPDSAFQEIWPQYLLTMTSHTHVWNQKKETQSYIWLQENEVCLKDHCNVLFYLMTIKHSCLKFSLLPKKCILFAVLWQNYWYIVNKKKGLIVMKIMS